jgi:hypothetical protein
MKTWICSAVDAVGCKRRNKACSLSSAVNTTVNVVYLVLLACVAFDQAATPLHGDCSVYF